jgi:hypothetical protein
MLHLRRQSPFRRISKIANLSAARICENRDSVVLGACIISHDDNPPIVVEHRVIDAPDLQAADGCSTKSVTRTDGSGASETHTKTNC